jgi:predicted DNA-binding protein
MEKKKTVLMSIRITEEQNHKLDKIKAGMGITKQFCIRKGLDLYFEETKEVKEFLTTAN